MVEKMGSMENSSFMKFIDQHLLIASFLVAELECGHQQHVRHNPPMTLRPWVNDENGRKERLGTFLSCKACDSESI